MAKNSDIKVAIAQSNYLPWLGYFKLISSCDIFVIHDGLAFSKGTFRNRNKVGLEKLSWLTIPVEYRQLGTPMSEVKVVGDWVDRHTGILRGRLGEMPFFSQELKNFLRVSQGLREEKFLSKVNETFILDFCNRLMIETEIKTIKDKDYLEKNERLVRVVRTLNGTVYVSSFMASNYLKPLIFERAGLKLVLENYRNLIEATSQFSRVDVSIVQTLSHVGMQLVRDVLEEEANSPQAYLSKVEQSDLPYIYELQRRVDWAVARGAKVPADFEATRKWFLELDRVQGKKWVRCIKTLETDNCLGYVTLEVVENKRGEMYIGILCPNRSGSGVSLQAVQLALIWAFNEFQATKVKARVNSTNEKSIRLFQKSGFVFENSAEQDSILVYHSWNLKESHP